MDNSSRYLAEKYPVKCIFFDLSHPWTRSISENVSVALSRFFSIASNVLGSNRIPAISLLSLGKQVECIFPLQSSKNNIAKLMHVLHEVKFQDGVFMDSKTYQDILSIAIQQAFNQFNRSFHANKQQHWSSLTQIEVCFITSKRQQILLGRCLANAFDEKILEFLKKIQIVQIEDSFELEEGYEDDSLDSDVDTSNNSALHDYLEFVKVSNCTTEIEFTMKSWLVDYCADQVQVCVEIADGYNAKGIQLKCDLNDRLLNLSMVPPYQQKLFQPGIQQPGCQHCGTSMKNSNTNTNTYVFKALQLIQLSGVCESVISGQPLIVRPTSCWRVDWEELDLNQQRFQAVRSFLLKQDICMLLESKEEIASMPKTFCIMMPSARTGMLLKCVANCDILLPLSSSLCIQEESEEIKNEVDSLLLRVARSETLNPLFLKAGICDKLMGVFETKEGKRKIKEVAKNPYSNSHRNGTSRSLMEVRPNNSRTSQANSQPAKRARCPYKSIPNKGSIFDRDPPDFPEDF